MKFGPDVLLEIVHIVQEGLVKGVDISQRLRDLDVVTVIDGLLESDHRVVLSEEYKKSKGR